MKHFVFRISFTLALMLYFFGAKAQPYGNEWIDYSTNRYYAKFPITQTGLYRLDYNTLSYVFQLLGTDIANIDPRSVQIFGRGKEQHIFINGEADGTFDSGDYIEFFAEKNDGWYDEQFYTNANNHTNPYYSLYSDVIYYFISWEPSGTHSNFRIEQKAFGTPATTPITYLWQTETKVFKNEYDIGDTTYYSGGKGWTSSHFGYNGGSGSGEVDFAPNLDQIYHGSGTPQSTFKFAITSNNNGAGGSQAHHVRALFHNATTTITLSDVVSPRFYFSKHSISINSSQIDVNSTFHLETNSAFQLISAYADYNKASYMELSFPRKPNFNGESNMLLEVPSSPVDLFLDATGWTAGNTPFIYDLDNKWRISAQYNSTSGSLKCNFKAGDRRKIFISTEASITSIASQDIIAVGSNGQFTEPITNTDSTYIIITNKALKTSAEAYENYRKERFNTAIFYIDELYDQFGAGIPRHPQSIRGFIEYAFDNWPSAPSHLFLIGKSVEESEYRGSAAQEATVLVPTMCYPPSDNMLTAGLNGKPVHVPLIPTGRITAQTNADVNLYLQKIKAQENTISDVSGSYTINNKLWQKRILHFAGGDDTDENESFRNYLDGFAYFAESSEMGAQRILFSKTTSNAIEQLDVDSVRTLIRDGVAIMNFFGHGSGNNFDVSVDNPEDWGNEFEGRYPLVIANSCYSGNIHRPVSSPSISEDYVFTPNEGAIGFVATPSESAAAPLATYTTKLYEQMSTLNYGKTLGQQMLATANSLSATTSNIGVSLEMTLHGDPAIKVFPHSLPEITINDIDFGPAISYQPEVITSNIDSFKVSVEVTNLGRSVTEPLNISATRTIEGKDYEDVRSVTLNELHFQEEVSFTFPVLPELGIGRNYITIQADLPNTLIEEFEEYSNNEIANTSFEISSTDIFPAYPYNYAVVPSFDVTLKANTGLPDLASNSYKIEIDTTDLFNSAWKKETTITQAAAVINWNPQLAQEGFQDSTVFFWRVAPADELDKWRAFSFQVINQKVGWGQDHFYQFKENEFDFLSYNRSNRTISFDSVSRDLFVNALGVPPNLGDNEFLSNHRYTLDGQGPPFGESGVAPGGLPSVLIAIIDSINLRPWGTYGIDNGILINQNHQFGNSNNYNPSSSRGRRVEYWFSFDATENGLNNAINMIQNHVEDGNYILMYSSVKGLFQDTNRWKETHYQTFESLGADSIRFVPNNNPYIFLAKKGDPSTAVEVIGRNSTDAIQLNTKLTSNIQLGEITSTEIGPVTQWQKMFFKHQAMEQNSADQAELTAYYKRSNEPVTSGSSNYETDISTLNADSVTTLSLKYFTKDSLNLTPAQLDNWHVLYRPAPEAAINPILGKAIPNEKVSSGSDLFFGLPIENISDYGFSELRVKYWLVNDQRELVLEKWLTYDTLSGNEVVFDSIKINTTGFSGSYTLSMEVNPIDSLWHPEQYHYNNTYYTSFSVEEDKQNPLLDVTFDGIHILNGDIVSPTPQIVMQVDDENVLLLMTDTSTFDVYLTYPNGLKKRIPFVINGIENMVFEPATDSKNKARLTWNPEQLTNGEYTLTVAARDASGNNSGSASYKVDFEVINETTVTSVVNYPNPFTTSTRFVFTLTGNELPDVFTIQIMTVTGKVVREITMDEIGPINIGRNISEYAWDGTDEFGDRLANGVYLYRVNMKLNGESIEKRATKADQYFTVEFGKMYLFR